MVLCVVMACGVLVAGHSRSVCASRRAIAIIVAVDLQITLDGDWSFRCNGGIRHDRRIVADFHLCHAPGALIEADGGVTANDVSIQTGFIAAWGLPLRTPFRRDCHFLLSIPADLKSRLHVCSGAIHGLVQHAHQVLLVGDSHPFEGKRAAAAGVWHLAVVKVVLGNLKYVLLVISSLLFTPQGAPLVPEPLPRPANFSWQSSSSSVGLTMDRSRPP